MTYSSDSPQQRAAAASVAARRQRAQDRKARAERDAYFAVPGLPEHMAVCSRCVCEGCEAHRAAARRCDNWRDSCHGDPEIDECVCATRANIPVFI